MRGRKTGQDKRIVKQQDGLSVEDVIHARHMATNKRGEIAVFDAEKYFAGAGNRRLRIKEMEEELDEDADVEASGDLPLSPLPEFYTTSNAKRYTRKDKWQQGDKAHVYPEAGVRNVLATKTTGGAIIASPAQRRTVTSIDPLRMPNGDSLPSPPSTASTGHDHVCNEPRTTPAANITNSTSDRVSQSKSSSIKPQPFSPSGRLASFLAKFKLSSSESKSKPSSQYSSATLEATPAAAVMPASKSVYPNAPALPANGKTPSPRGRFLRALSSSSSHSNSLLKPIHQHNSIAASTPVSPAGSADPYSPITHSASTTPTSRKNPRSRSRSHVSNHEGISPGSRLSLPTTDWRRDLDNSHNRSFSTHLPFLRRKLKAYLMPEKSSRHHHENHQQGMNKQDKMNIHRDHHHVHNGARAEDRQQRAYKASATSVSDRLQVASHLPGVDDRQHHTHKGNTASTDEPRADGSAAHMPAEQSDCDGYTTRLQGRRMTEQPTTKDTRRRGEWRRHAEEMEDDIEVAERLLRVVKEHQSSQTYTSRYKGTSNYRQQSSNGYTNYQANGHGGEINGSSSRKSRKSLMSPSSSPAANYHSKQTSKEEFACPYDSDSSSDLFEIETLQAYSHVAGLYRPRDLPVYDSNPLKSPLHRK